VTAASFHERNLVSAAGLLVPVMRLAADAGLGELAGELLTVPTDKGANAGGKVTALVAGMLAGADSIDDMALLRHGAIGKLFDQLYARSTLGSFLRAFTFGHARQLDAVASRLLTGLAQRSDLLPGLDGMVLVDVDDSIVEVHGHAKQGAGFGYTRVRGLNMLLATASTAEAAPVIVGQRLRKGSCASPRGAKRLVADALKTVRSLRPDGATGRCCCARTRRSTALRRSVRRCGRERRCRSPSGWTPRSRRRSPPSPTTPGPDRVHRRPSSTSSPGNGSPGRGR
jgi:hypothetical protein